jgi:hypothetical protein
MHDRSAFELKNATRTKDNQPELSYIQSVERSEARNTRSVSDLS